jgi:hypothetical protein
VPTVILLDLPLLGRGLILGLAAVEFVSFLSVSAIPQIQSALRCRAVQWSRESAGRVAEVTIIFGLAPQSETGMPSPSSAARAQPYAVSFVSTCVNRKHNPAFVIGDLKHRLTSPH